MTEKEIREIPDMSVQEMLEAYDAPSVPLIDISEMSLPQKNLVKLLIRNGIETTNALRAYSDEALLKMPLFGVTKLQKLKELLTEWYENDFLTKNYLDPTNVMTVISSLQAAVFGTYKNIEIPAKRWNGYSFEDIASKYGTSRQSVQDKEKVLLGKFMRWYADYRVSEKIGTYDDLRLYCDQNFPADQSMMRDAVKRMISMVK